MPRRLYKEFPKFNDWIDRHELNGAIFLPFETQNSGKVNTYNITVGTYDHSYLLANGIRTFNSALFGEPEEGVFSPDAIEACLVDYDMNDCSQTEGAKRILGVDWNAHTGTHITIVEYVNGKYILIHKTVVPKSEFTQHRGVEKIIELNKEWDPDYIYIDAGFGDVQIEMLKMTGLAQPSTGIYDKLRPIQMGRHVAINEPGTGVEIRKATKQFMVEIAVHHVEENYCVFPVSEDTDAIMESGQTDNPNVGLVQQMRNFLVVRVSSTGQPVYSQGYEHTLTAWMLCILGFQMEWGGLLEQNSSSRISFGGRFGQAKEEEQRSRYGSAVPISQMDLKPRSRTGSGKEAEWETDKDGTWRKMVNSHYGVTAQPQTTTRKRIEGNMERRYHINKSPRKRKM